MAIKRNQAIARKPRLTRWLSTSVERSKRIMDLRRQRTVRRLLALEMLEDRRLLTDNQPPVNSVPPAQSTFVAAPLALTPYKGNGVSIFDPDAADNPIEMSVSVEHGTLSFVYPDPAGGDLTYLIGDGTEDRIIKVRGPQATINAALAWMAYNPPDHSPFVRWAASAGGNDHWYSYLSTPAGTWQQSRDFAISRGGYLATITSAAEQAFIQTIVPANVNMYLGGFQNRSSSQYTEPTGGREWVTGETWNHTNWLSGEPNNSGSNEDFLEQLANQNYRWNDSVSTHTNRSLLIEYNTDPRKFSDKITITTNDLGYTGRGGPKEDTDTIDIEIKELSFADSPGWTTFPAAFDTSFNGTGRQILSVSSGTDFITQMQQLPDGKIIAAGAVNNHFVLIRFNSEMSLKAALGSNVVVEMSMDNGRDIVSLAVDRNGSYVVEGHDCMAKYIRSRNLDTICDNNEQVASRPESNLVYDVENRCNGCVANAGKDSSQSACVTTFTSSDSL
jgi:hypothetical protein